MLQHRSRIVVWHLTRRPYATLVLSPIREAMRKVKIPSIFCASHLYRDREETSPLLSCAQLPAQHVAPHRLYTVSTSNYPPILVSMTFQFVTEDSAQRKPSISMLIIRLG